MSDARQRSATKTSERASADILWAALGEPGNEDQRQGVVAAFALIAAADGHAGAAELVTFKARVQKSAVFSHGDEPALWADYDALVHGLIVGDAQALPEVEKRLVRCADEASRAVVLAAARAALVADGEDNEREEVALAHIARLIGASDP